MKRLLTGLLVLGSLSAIADCSIECTYEGKASFGAQIGKVAGEVFLGGSRAYGTYVKACQVLDVNGEVFYENKISGAKVTQVAPWGSQNAGQRLQKTRDRREKKQEASLAEELSTCCLATITFPLQRQQ